MTPPNLAHNRLLAAYELLLAAGDRRRARLAAQQTAAPDDSASDAATNTDARESTRQPDSTPGQGKHQKAGRP
jgi:hypothetical protein